jgi:hypothetical protein
MALELRFQCDGIGIAKDERQQAQGLQFRRILLLLGGKQLRPREIVSLEQIEAQAACLVVLFLGFHFLGDHTQALPA